MTEKELKDLEQKWRAYIEAVEGATQAQWDAFLKTVREMEAEEIPLEREKVLELYRASV